MDVWLYIRRDYDDTEIVGVYATAEAAMGKGAHMWTKIDNNLYAHKNNTKRIGEYISREEVRGG